MKVLHHVLLNFEDSQRPDKKPIVAGMFPRSPEAVEVVGKGGLNPWNIHPR